MLFMNLSYVLESMTAVTMGEGDGDRGGDEACSIGWGVPGSQAMIWVKPADRHDHCLM